MGDKRYVFFAQDRLFCDQPDFAQDRLFCDQHDFAQDRLFCDQHDFAEICWGGAPSLAPANHLLGHM